MPIFSDNYAKNKNERGATAVIVALLIAFVLVPIGAIVIDLSILYVARNELKNAADAGALAGASNLYIDNGEKVNPEANTYAFEITTANLSMGSKVEVLVEKDSDDFYKNSTSTETNQNNWYDIERGHWTFNSSGGGSFLPNDSLNAVSLVNKSDDELNLDIDFINAVRVVARRQATPITSFFARLFGYESFELSAESIAYIGFAGTIEPLGVDQPIALCEHTLLNNGEYQCNVGRKTSEPKETGAWTDFNQSGDPCQGGTNDPLVGEKICSIGNPIEIRLGQDMAVINGQLANSYSDFYTCWKNATNKEKPWTVKLPVIDCSGNSNNCAEVVGVVNVDIMWVYHANAQGTGVGTDSQYNWVPRIMENNQNLDENGEPTIWTCDPNEPGDQCWADFVDVFNLLDEVGSTPASYEPKSVYFRPSCEKVSPTGVSGGQNFGVLASIPVLVK